MRHLTWHHGEGYRDRQTKGPTDTGTATTAEQPKGWASLPSELLAVQAPRVVTVGKLKHMSHHLLDILRTAQLK